MKETFYTEAIDNGISKKELRKLLRKDLKVAKRDKEPLDWNFYIVKKQKELWEYFKKVNKKQ